MVWRLVYTHTTRKSRAGVVGESLEGVGYINEEAGCIIVNASGSSPWS